MNGKEAMRTIGIITKHGNELAEKTANDIKKWLFQRELDVWLHDSNLEDVSLESIPPTQLVLVLGGDGTIISVSRRILPLHTPVVGVNFGRVGFLAELTEKTWQTSLEKALTKGLTVESRFVLHYSLVRDGAIHSEGDVINDVVITRGKTARLVRLDLALDSEPLMQLRSDGLIISTPTGSSGYACSAGGSLLEPTLDAYIVASICPFLNVFSPLVLRGGAEFEVKLPDSSLDLYLTLDGQETIALEANDCIRVQRSANDFLLANMDLEGYGKRLRRAGFIGDLGVLD